MINERWPLRPLGELFEIGAGKTMSATARDGEGRIPFLRTSNVLWDEIDLSTVDRMAIPPHELEMKLLRPGDLLVCEGGDIGRAAVWNGEVEVMSFQNHLHRLRPLVEDVEPRFYVYFLQSGFTQLGIFEGAGNRTTIPNLSRNRLASLEVPHPDLDEQRAILRALVRVRDGVRVHNQAHELAQVLKGAAMRRLFTRGLRGEPQKETELGLVPESWALVKLGEVCRLSTGTTPSTKRPDYYAGDVPFIKTAEIVNNRLNNATTYVSRAAVADYGLRIYPPGTVLMAMYGQGKTRGQVALLETSAATTQNAAAIEPNESILASFLWHYLRNSYHRLRGVGSLGHLSHLNLGYLRDILVVCPPPSEQVEVVAVLDAIDNKISLHERKRGVLDDLFKSLLHKLMTGEIRITDVDLSVLGPNGSAPAAA